MGTGAPTADASRADNGVLRADNGAAASGRFMVRSAELIARRVTTLGRIGTRVGRAFETPRRCRGSEAREVLRLGPLTADQARSDCAQWERSQSLDGSCNYVITDSNYVIR